MKRSIITLAIVFSAMLCVGRASAGSGWWTEAMPIDGYGKTAFISTDFDWQGNYFTWDGGAVGNGADYWKPQILNHSSSGIDPTLTTEVKFRSEVFWGKFSLGYISGEYNYGIMSNTAVDFYQHLYHHNGVPGTEYNIGERLINLSYRGISVGYTSEDLEARWRWGIRCNLLQGLNYSQSENVGLVTFNSPNKADAYIYQTTWGLRRGSGFGKGYSVDLYARYEPAPDWSIAFSWQDLGQITWSDVGRRERTIVYETETDPNGNIVPPIAYGNRLVLDRTVELEDHIQIGFTKHYTGGDVTFGLEYRGGELSWGAGWAVGLGGENRLILNYDDRFGGFGVGWENPSLSILLKTSSLRLNDATTIGLGMTWKV